MESIILYLGFNTVLPSGLGNLKLGQRGGGEEMSFHSARLPGTRSPCV